jgi:penicillin-binding protein 1A
MTKLLQGVVHDGTSSSITLDRLVECAGKTGTTQNDYDRWFVGYTPELICGVWCGYEYPQPLEGSNLCTGIWNRVMHQIVLPQEAKKNFDMPSSVVKMSYCKDSGKLMDDACLFDPRGDRAQVGWFVVGNEPSGKCDRHVLCYADREGGISHGFCPEQSLQRVGLIRVERHFPMQILVSDGQYVYRGDPRAHPPNPNMGQAYFEGDLQDFCGRSHTDLPYNHSCPLHQIPPIESENGDEAKMQSRKKNRIFSPPAA